MSAPSNRRQRRALATAFATVALVATSLAALPAASAITNGQDAPRTGHAYMVGLVSPEIDEDYDAQFCGASLIAVDWVLTAAHCVEGTDAEEVQALVGAHDLGANDGTRVDVDDVVVHDGYDAEDLVDDIALLHLTVDQPAANVIALPTGGDSALEAAGADVVLTGWGGVTEESGDDEVDQTYPTVLQTATMPVIAASACESLVDSEITSGQLCAGARGVDSCYGDSGGPLAGTRAGGQRVVLGVVSWGPGCGSAPSVYTRVSAYTTWIAEQIDGAVDVDPTPTGPADDDATSGAIERIAGADRYETAARLATELFEPGVPAAFVVTGLSHPDALAAAPAAAALGAPLLLTSPDDVPVATARAIELLRPERVYVVGGAAVISDAVVAELDATRVAGVDRYATAAALSRLAFDSLPEDAPMVFVAGGEGFADALAGGAAAAADPATPLLLTPAARLAPSTAAELARLDPAVVYIVGGTNAVSASVERTVAAGCDCEVIRLAGADRYATAAAIALEVFGAADEVVIVTGTSFPDGLVAGSLGLPVLLVPADGVPTSVTDALADLGVGQLLVLGGTGAVDAPQAGVLATLLSR